MLPPPPSLPLLNYKHNGNCGFLTVRGNYNIQAYLLLIQHKDHELLCSLEMTTVV